MLKTLKFIFIVNMIVLLESSFSFATVKKVYPEIIQLQKLYLDRSKNNQKSIRAIINNFSNDQEFKFQLGELFLALGNYLDAEIQFKKLYAETPKDKYEIAYADALIFQKKFEEALYVINLNSLSDELKSKKYALRAKSLLGLDNTSNALKNIDEALLLQPDDVEYGVLKARILTALDRVDQSQDLLDDIEKKINKNIIISLLKAENYIVKKDYISAKTILNDILVHDKSVYDGYSARGRVNLLMNLNHEAIKDGLAMMELDRQNPTGIYIVGSALNQQGKYQDALKLYDGKGDQKALFLPGLLLESELNFNAGIYGRALVLLNKYLQVSPNDTKALKLRGILKLRHSTPREATEDLEKANRLNNTDPFIMTALASAYYRSGEYELAEGIYTHLQKEFSQVKTSAYDALQLSCNLPNVRKQRQKFCQDPFSSEISERVFEALDLMYIGQLDRAFANIKKLYKLYPQNMLVLKSYARIIASSKNVDQSIDLFFTALKAQPNDQELLSELYVIYQKGNSSINIMNRLLEFFETNNVSVDAGYYLVNFFYKAGNYPQAARIANMMVQRRSGDKFIYETALKVMVFDPVLYKKEISDYLKTYTLLNGKNQYLIRIIRQAILRTEFTGHEPDILALPLQEKTAADFQIFAEYLRFIKNIPFAEKYYKLACEKFNTNFELFNSAFNFFEQQKDSDQLKKLIQQFRTDVPDYKVFFQARLHAFEGDYKTARESLTTQFQENYHGMIGKLLLQIDPSDQTLELINNNFNYVKQYDKELVVTLADRLYYKQEFSRASSILLPFYKQLERKPAYLLVLAKNSFYSDFIFANQIIEGLLKKYPKNKQYIIENIAFLAKGGHFSQAISYFENHDLSVTKNPSLGFYYGLSLYYDHKKDKAYEVFKILLDHKKALNFPEKLEAKKLLKEFTQTNN